MGLTRSIDVGQSSIERGPLFCKTLLQQPPKLETTPSFSHTAPVETEYPYSGTIGSKDRNLSFRNDRSVSTRAAEGRKAGYTDFVLGSYVMGCTSCLHLFLSTLAPNL